jgi:AcrR family transcriptional regulator
MKEQLVETALKQFLADGIRSNTMQKLASAMGVSTKTLYKYFADKEALLEECLKVHYGQTDTGLQRLLADEPDPVTFLCRLYTKSIELDFGTNHLFYHDLNYYYPDLQDKAIKQFSNGAFKVLLSAIAKGIAEGYFLPYLKPAVVLEALAVLYTSVTRHNTYKKFKLKPDKLMAHTIDIYLRGICTEKGSLIINQIKDFNN